MLCWRKRKPFQKGGLNELRCKKTGLRGFQPGPTQTGLYMYSHRRKIESSNFGYK